MLKEFREFIAKGNVLELAVAVIIGVAFGAIVTSLVDDIIMPVVGVIIGGVNFSNLTINIGEAAIRYGNFIQAAINFLIVALVLFLVIKAYNRFVNTVKQPAAVDPTTKDCPYCLTALPLKATRCSACTSQLGVADAAATKV